MAVWQCGVCEGINNGGTTCATCGAVIPPGVSPPPPAPPPAAPPRNVSPRSAPPPGASPPPPSPSPPPGSRPARPPVRLARPRSAAPRPAPPGAPPRPRPRPRPRPGTRAPWPPPGGWYEPAARPAPRRRPIAWLVRSLALLVVLVAWAYAASYAPGLAPQSMASVRHHLLALPSSTDCPAPPCPSGSGALALGVAFDGDDTLVLIAARRSTAPDRIVVAFERSARTLTIDRGGSGAGWTVTDPRGVRYPTLPADDRGVLAVRVPGPAPAPRWAANVAGERVPSREFAPVARPQRPRDALLDNPAASVIVALFVALVVAPRGYGTASRRVLARRFARPAVRSGHRHRPAAPRVRAARGGRGARARRGRDPARRAGRGARPRRAARRRHAGRAYAGCRRRHPPPCGDRRRGRRARRGARLRRRGGPRPVRPWTDPLSEGRRLTRRRASAICRRPVLELPVLAPPHPGRPSPRRPSKELLSRGRLVRAPARAHRVFHAGRC